MKFNMKQLSGFCSLLFLVAVAALAFFNFLSSNAGSSFPDLPAANNYGYRTTHIALISRKLKENGIKNHKVENGYLVNIDDYHGDDHDDYKPTRTSPTEHGTPLQPYIPKPPSPDLPSPPGYN